MKKKLLKYKIIAIIRKKESTMKEKRNSILLVALLLIILGLVGYILIEKEIIKIPGITKENTPVEQKEKKEVIKLDTNNDNIKALITQVHNPGEKIDSVIYEKGGSKVKDMSEEYKFAIATNTKDISITEIIPVDDTNNTGYIAEEDVKEAYERLFGPRTYHEINTFKYGCVDMSYDSTNKRYVTTSQGCGIAMTPVEVYEEIMSATKENNKLTVITAVAFFDSSVGKLYRDSALTEQTSLTTNPNLTEEEIREYIPRNKDSLTQYTYTFYIGTDGFYYYQGVERTKD